MGGVATHLGDDKGDIVDNDNDLVPTDSDFVLALGSSVDMLAKEQIDAAVLNTLVVGVPPAVFAETDLPCRVDCPKSCFGHMRYLVRVGLSMMMVTGPSLTSRTAMLA